ncbi:MAG: 4Fe-4S binding protein, partial [Synechococcaceae bacterium WB6_3B_236]|nr:4Fe-4S binding protein [Synechococcaceae bacterium WB6_3B_236]
MDLRRLAPYLVAQTRRGIVGSSRYAKSLREAVRQAAADPSRQPVLLMGEPGLEKDNLAALIHFGSSDRRLPLIRLDAALLRADGADLFGPGSGEQNSLLDCLEGGSLLVDNVDRADPALQERLLGLADSHPGRLLFTSETALPSFDRRCRLIRVPPLRVR